MRSFLFTLSIYLLALSCIACNDLDSNAESSLQMVTTTNQQQQNRQKSEECTPFCSCSCCPASAFYQKLIYFNFDKLVFQSVKYPAFNSNFYSEVAFSVWHPPKIS